jgi:hypothetical protein
MLHVIRSQGAGIYKFQLKPCELSYNTSSLLKHPLKPKPIGYRCIGLGTNTKSGLLTPFMRAKKKYSLVLLKKKPTLGKV